MLRSWFPLVGGLIPRVSKSMASISTEKFKTLDVRATVCAASGAAAGIVASARKSLPSQRRALCTKKFDWKGGSKDENSDEEYLPFRLQMDNAKAVLDKLIKPGMSEAEIHEQIEKVFQEHIPPAPHWTDIIKEHDEKVERDKSYRKEQAVKRTEALRRLIKIPVRDALGRAYSTGKRKTSVARVWVTEGNGTVIVNKKHMVDYFPRLALREEIFQPLMVTGKPMNFNVWCTVKGGGKTGQAGAVKLGVARALQAFDPEYRRELKSFKLLTQDDRQVERKKPGQTKARKKFQWVKR